MPWDENLTNLNYVLAGLYPLTSDSYRIVDAAGLPRAQIAFQPKAIDNWYSILDQADKRGKVLDVIRAARRDYPEDASLIQAENGQLTTARGPLIGQLPWNGQLGGDTLEKIIRDQSTLLPISFLETGLDRARAVARIQRADGTLGTGFLTAGNILVTNHHVLPSEAEARAAVARFNYQQTAAGLDREPASVSLAPEAGFATSAEDDWTAVRLQADANAAWGAIAILPIDVGQVRYVNIIQHPGGGPKQIALYHNVVVWADVRRVQYLTDTQPGSSGSPVFDSQWQLVALHHSGGWLPDPGTQQLVFRNEGINVNCLRRGLQQAGLLDSLEQRS
jgi:hypothetical protein